MDTPAPTRSARQTGDSAALQLPSLGLWSCTCANDCHVMRHSGNDKVITVSVFSSLECMFFGLRIAYYKFLYPQSLAKYPVDV